MNGVNSNMIANLVSSFATERYGLDLRYSVLFTTLISSVLIGADLSFLPSLSVNMYGVGYTLLLVMLSGAAYWIYNRKKKDDEYHSLRTYKYDDFCVIRFMMKTHPDFYDKEYDMVTGNPECRDLEEFFVPQEDVEVKFNDTVHNIKGYLTMDYSEFTKDEGGRDSKPTQKKAYYMTVYILKGQKINCDQYMDKLEKYKKKKQDETDELELYMVKIMGKSTSDGGRDDSYKHEVMMYEGAKDNWEERYNQYMLSYFSPVRDRLWKYFYNIQHHPEKFSRFGQEARCNLLLHGPPGTGKSSFVYRLAMSLGRHIVSVDITALSNDRTEVYKVIQTPTINDEWCEPKDFIVLLEEFDIAVKHLSDKNKRPSMADIWNMGPKKRKKKKVDDDEDDEKDIDDTISYSRSTREFELEDLLEILQGPVPIKSSIIIATTNKYKEISELCPALFRPGRLTPVEFGYMDWSSLQQMTEHYFKQRLTFKETEIKIPTSEIVELALDSSLYDDEGFARFEAGLKTMLK
jgi:hypothetical protein